MFQLIKQTLDGAPKPFQVVGFRKPVIAVLDEQDFDVGRAEPVGDFLTRLPGNVLIGGAVNQAYRAIERDLQPLTENLPLLNSDPTPYPLLPCIHALG